MIKIDISWGKPQLRPEERSARKANRKGAISCEKTKELFIKVKRRKRFKNVKKTNNKQLLKREREKEK